MKIDGYSKHTHSLTHVLLPPPTPTPHTPTQDLGKMREKGDSTGIYSVKLEITTLIKIKKG